ncbi:hypothetical protein [Hymenobacter weizhouensis]|uniref:hypothetical protein n=1 Tax=Hymenobacter sp. YIM 151500-1 TaxID=2987689 RepID=UPI002225D50A|nr:hypothetical protein [Hymenobacter sp. YIM 151500-1]UYZ65101.1 hypothetical protein OIS53_09655 [Hymenobacter sp. YIM 151500-1]
MKSVAAFLLGVWMLLGSMVPRHDLTELSKLPQLLDHYRYHRSLAAGRLSMLEFLALHYGPQGPGHRRRPASARDAQDHHHLPLEHHHHDCLLVSFVLPAGRLALPPRLLPWPAPTYRPVPGTLYTFSVSSPLPPPPRV